MKAIEPCWTVIFTAAFLTAWLEPHPARADETIVPASVNVGRVFAYGQEILPPFEFTGVGTDTLFLNGVPYSPVRRPPPMVSTTFSITEEQAQIVRQVQEEARAAFASAGSSGEGLARAAAICKASPHVERCRVLSNSIRMRFTFYTFDIELPLRRPNELRSAHYGYTRTDVHEEIIAQFDRSIKAGSLIAIGAGYRFSEGPLQAETTLGAVDAIIAGRTPSSMPSSRMGRLLVADVAETHKR